MSLRTDPLTGRSVILASHRAARPNEFADRDKPADKTQRRLPDCPFCAGNESRTPASLQEATDSRGGWAVRAIPNKYPLCLSNDGNGAATADDGPLDGAHEVIVESAAHLLTTGQLQVEQLADVLSVYHHRLDHWRRSPRYPFRLLFKNVGPSGGASLSHLHSQLVAASLISAQLAEEERRVRASADPAAAWGDWLDDQLCDAQRLVAQSDGLVAFCPRVSRSPFETWLMPRERAAYFEDAIATPEGRLAAARTLLPVVRAVEQEVAPHGYNIILYTAPTAPGYEAWCWWRLEIVPRINALAGFELGTGVYINTLPAEQAAAILRRKSDPAGS